MKRKSILPSYELGCSIQKFHKPATNHNNLCVVQ